MASHSKYLTFEDFYDKIASPNFDQTEIMFQSKMAIKAGYSSWKEYVKFIYQRNLNILNVKALCLDLRKKMESKIAITDSLIDIQNKYKPKPLSKKTKSIFKKVNTFPPSDQIRIEQFELKLSRLYIILSIDLNKEDPITMGLFEVYFKESEMRYRFLDPLIADSLKEAGVYIKSLKLPDTNAFINQIISPNFYFPKKAHLLKLIHDELLAIDLIEENKDFEILFEFETNYLKKAEQTIWKGKNKRELLYLLYILNDKKEVTDRNLSIATIAYRLFKFNKSLDENKLCTNFREAVKSFPDELYVAKNMKKIVQLAKKLLL